MKCDLCNEEKEIIKHHIDYNKDITIPICIQCHRKIHGKHNHNLDYLKPINNIPTSSVCLTKDVTERLKTFKITKLETYNEIIIRLMDITERFQSANEVMRK